MKALDMMCMLTSAAYYAVNPWHAKSDAGRGQGNAGGSNEVDRFSPLQRFGFKLISACIPT